MSCGRCLPVNRFIRRNNALYYSCQYQALPRGLIIEDREYLAVKDKQALRGGLDITHGG